MGMEISGVPRAKFLVSILSLDVLSGQKLLCCISSGQNESLGWALRDKLRDDKETNWVVSHHIKKIC